MRQRRVDGTAVVETRVRVPQGDAVQRVYSVADDGGLTVVEVENDSPLPIAVAFTHGRLLSARPPTAPIAGIELPEGSVVFPIGHRATVTVAMSHTRDEAGTLPTGLPSAADVARGWLATVQRAGRLATPDVELNDRVVAALCELSLVGPPSEPAQFAIAIDQLVRMGERADQWVPELANAVERMVKSAAPESAFVAADRVLAAAGEARARRDLAAMVERLKPRPGELSDEDRILRTRWKTIELLPEGIPASWLGVNFEVFDMPTIGTGKVSYAIRWHGDRPAVLWEQVAGSDGPVTLTSPTLAPQWSTAQLTGEALWPAVQGC